MKKALIGLLAAGTLVGCGGNTYKHPDIELLVKKLHENKGEWVGNYVKLNKEYSKEIFELACK